MKVQFWIFGIFMAYVQILYYEEYEFHDQTCLKGIIWRRYLFSQIISYYMYINYSLVFIWILCNNWILDDFNIWITHVISKYEMIAKIRYNFQFVYLSSILLSTSLRRSKLKWAIKVWSRSVLSAIPYAGLALDLNFSLRLHQHWPKPNGF